MIQNGCKPIRLQHTDYSILKTRKFGAVTPAFAENYSIDAKLWIPNQQSECALFNPHVPPMPFGCTDYAQNELCMDEDGVLYNPVFIEAFTHANENQGGDVRVALKSVTKNGVQDQQGNIIKDKHPVYFTIQPSGAIDWFDAVRLAMLSSSSEKRGISIGSYYWHEFNSVGLTGIYQTPSYDKEFASLHNWVVKGWMTIEGVTYLVCQMLQGTGYGKNGITLMTRGIFNKTMSFWGSGAFMLDKLLPGEVPETVDMNIVQWIFSYVRSLFGL